MLQVDKNHSYSHNMIHPSYQRGLLFEFTFLKPQGSLCKTVTTHGSGFSIGTSQHMPSTMYVELLVFAFQSVEGLLTYSCAAGLHLGLDIPYDVFSDQRLLSATMPMNYFIFQCFLYLIKYDGSVSRQVKPSLRCSKITSV